MIRPVAASCGFGPAPEPELLGLSVKFLQWVYMKQYLLSNSSLTRIQDLTLSGFDVGLKLILNV